MRGNKIQADGLLGNLVETTSGNFTTRIFEGMESGGKLGIDYLETVGVVAGIGNPAVGLAANVLGSVFS